MTVKRITTFIAVCLISTRLSAQTGISLSGKIVDTGNQPIRGASVFFNGTSKGAVSGTDGRFIINNIRGGNYQLIVSCIGYETFVANIRGDRLPRRIIVILRPEATQLAAAVVEPYLADGWERYGQLFMDNFIGTTPNAAKCQLRNRSALRFYLSQKTDRLSVTANEPLLIENKALGYTLEYRLVRFLYDFNRNIISFTGYPLFHEMTTDRVSLRDKWAINRQNTYHGSLMQFMRALFEGDSALPRAAFSLRRTIQETNHERCRVQETFHPDSPVSRAINRDSLSYYRRVLKQAAIISRVIYAGSNLVSARRTSRSRITPKESSLQLVTPLPIIIDQNGAYTTPLELVEKGFWARSEKIANLLPWGYSPAIDDNPKKRIFAAVCRSHGPNRPAY